MRDKTRENAFGKTRERQFSGKSSVSFKINRRPWENDFGQFFEKEIFQKIIGKFSVDFRNIFVFPM